MPHSRLPKPLPIVGINDDPENDQQKNKNGWTRSRTRSRTWVASINRKSFDH
ncbi:BQ5605_C023g09633 [Microbotryum silenes-dioicae]|uniref:BQ5605_C023g09633 protein n=1 Tax=Microbotryum silenes-dioicae TaxID=796604 RepID=A0A2X0ML81_9BASI|nr:BQ5605_C023g09633 [Microbotryum silenes-dioicae]